MFTMVNKAVHVGVRLFGCRILTIELIEPSTCCVPHNGSWQFVDFNVA